VNTILSRYRS